VHAEVDERTSARHRPRREPPAEPGDAAAAMERRPRLIDRAETPRLDEGAGDPRRGRGSADEPDLEDPSRPRGDPLDRVALRGVEPGGLLEEDVPARGERLFGERAMRRVRGRDRDRRERGVGEERRRVAMDLRSRVRGGEPLGASRLRVGEGGDGPAGTGRGVGVDRPDPARTDDAEAKRGSGRGGRRHACSRRKWRRAARADRRRSAGGRRYGSASLRSNDGGSNADPLLPRCAPAIHSPRRS